MAIDIMQLASPETLDTGPALHDDRLTMYRKTQTAVGLGLLKQWADCMRWSAWVCTGNMDNQFMRKLRKMVIPPSHELIRRLHHAKSITVITGAGMSAESGVPTFRDATTGLWSQFDAYALASPQGWKKCRSRVWAWYEWRRGLVSRTQPHSGHFAITELSKVVGERPDGNGKFTLITQNVDDLHERAGFADALHVHGSLFEPRCSACGNSSAFLAEPPLEAIEHIEPPLCTRCGGYVRPGVVWFGESLPTRLWHQSVRAVQECEVLLVVGTSGVVHPIADLPSMARKSGAWVCEINPQATQITHVAQHSWRESAAVGLPLLLQDWPCP